MPVGLAGNGINMCAPTIINSYGGGNVLGTYPGGLVGGQPNKAGTGLANYYLVSDTVSNSVGTGKFSIESTPLTEVTQDIIDNLNKNIEDDIDGTGTTGWAKWGFDENLYPTLDITTIWNGTAWEKTKN